MKLCEVATDAFDQVACNDVNHVNHEAELLAAEEYKQERYEHARTMSFAVFIVFQLFNVLNCRSEARKCNYWTWFVLKQSKNYAVLFSVGLLFFLSISVVINNYYSTHWL